MHPTPIVTPALLAKVRSQPHLPRNTWYFLTGVTLSALNRPEEISTVFKHAIENGGGSADAELGHAERFAIARRMREALVKAAAIGGLPRTINALFELKKATPTELLDEPLAYSPTGRVGDVYDVSSSAILQRGKLFFDHLYGKVSQRVMSQMDRSGSEDLGLTARLMYAYILSNERVLSASETSFVLLAGLIPQDVNAQLKGHLKGATHHDGITIEQVKAVREIIIKICEAAGMRKLDDTPGGWGWRGPIANL